MHKGIPIDKFSHSKDFTDGQSCESSTWVTIINNRVMRKPADGQVAQYYNYPTFCPRTLPELIIKKIIFRQL